ncbi:hypothetical protein [Spirosoma telluris]|uniref:hypothetical protein n=1 Tax=Spirosoma telluris TaxID=2183553 RepID=UPI002FC383AF
MENQWRFELYGGGLVNYQKLIELADANNAKAYSGIAKIMKAYTFSIATDFWAMYPILRRYWAKPSLHHGWINRRIFTKGMRPLAFKVCSIWYGMALRISTLHRR